MNSTVLTKHKKTQTAFGKLLLLLIVVVGCAFAYTKLSGSISEIQQEEQSAIESQLSEIMQQKDVINTNWLRTLNPLVKNVEGRVVWSNFLQEGVMEFIGLPKINENQQYQLWVFDLVGKDSKPLFSKEFTKVNSEKLFVPFSSKLTINNAFKFELVLKTDGENVAQPLFLAQP